MTALIDNDFPTQLRYWRHGQNLNQVDAAKLLRIDRSYYSQLERGRRKPGDAVRIRFENIAHKQGLGVPGGPILPGGAGDLGFSRVPVLSWAQAGQATEFDQLPEDWQETVPCDIDDEKAFAVRLRGDSMEPRFEDGDIAIVLGGIPPRNGDIVLASLIEEGALCKIMHTQLDKNIITLSSYNPVYPPMQYRREDFHWMHPVAQIIKHVRKS